MNQLIKSLFLRLQNLKYMMYFFITIFITTLPLSIYLIINAPDDYLQKIYYKIMYIHVPSAWLASLLYILMSINCILYIIFRNPIYDLLARSISSIGIFFCINTIVTGAIWGKPTWGVYWAWDTRLTSMLILLIIYWSYISLRNNLMSENKASHISSIFATVGLINIPIIKFSVNLWNTLHQPVSIFRPEGMSIHASMQKPLLFSICTIFSMAGILIIMNIITYINIAKNNR